MWEKPDEPVYEWLPRQKIPHMFGRVRLLLEKRTCARGVGQSKELALTDSPGIKYT